MKILRALERNRVPRCAGCEAREARLDALYRLNAGLVERVREEERKVEFWRERAVGEAWRADRRRRGV